MFVLAQGDGRVLVFDADWQWIRSFGGGGQGPGDIEAGDALFVDADSVCVIEASYVTWFTLDGEVLSKTQLPEALTQSGHAARFGDRFAALTPFAPTLGAVFDGRGAIQHTFGPECSMFTESGGVRCTSFILVGSDRPGVGGIVLDPIVGEALVLDDRFETSSTTPIHVEPGRTWREGNASYMKAPLRAATSDRHGGYYLAVTRTDGDDQTTWEIHHLDGELAPTGRWRLPDGVLVYDLFVSPRDRICIADKWSSAIRVVSAPSSPAVR